MRSAFACSVAIGMLAIGACSISTVREEESDEAPLPAFEFKKFTAKTDFQTAVSAGLVYDCGEEYDGVVTCRVTDARIGRAESDRYLTWVFFENGALDWFSIEVPRDQYKTAIESLRSAYGEPCEVGFRTLQNGFGAQVVSDVTVWCFSDGRLSFYEKSMRNIQFTDLTFRPFRKKAPPASFTPDQL